ncbi:DUF6216 family protein [Pseudomonas putida]
MKNAETSTLLTFTFQNWAVVTSILGGVIMAMAMIYIYRRSGSFFFLRDRVWRFFDGKQTFDDPRFEKMRKRARELEFFRFEFNIPVKSFSDAERAEKWITQHQLPIDDVSLSRSIINWDDFADIRLRTYLTTQNIFTLLRVCVITLFLLTIASTLLIANPFVLMHFKQNGPSFYVAKNQVYLEMGAAPLTLADCSSAEKLAPFTTKDFTSNRLDVLCQILLPPFSDGHEGRIADQREISALLSAEIFAGFAFAVRLLAKVKAARRLERQISVRNGCVACAVRRHGIPEYEAKRLLGQHS